jgi:polyribonucleotide nucleotidyltransferase
MQNKVTAQIGSHQISIETGKIAKLADGAVVVSCGDTMVFTSAVSATSIKEGQDWFPLTVDYREKAAAVGKFPGGYFKREGRPSEKETLTSRMTDRPLRPLFPQGYLYDTQVISILLSADGQNDPDILAINGASLRSPFPTSIRRPCRCSARRPREWRVHRQPNARRAHG